MSQTAIRVKILSMAAVVVVAGAFTSAAYAQQTYRCGNTYSQTPCADGKALDVQDKRTDEQKAQAGKVTRDTEDSVNKLAAERKAREKSEKAQLRLEKAAQKAEADKKKIHRTPFTPYSGKHQKPEKAVKPGKAAPSTKPSAKP
jgi:hypothetical protein